MGSRRLGNVVAGLSQDGGLWRVNVDSDELDGYVEYRHPRRGAAAGGPGAGRVYARLSRLNLPKGEAERVESLLDEQPASVPALDIVVDDFELRGKRLGRLEIEAANRADGGRDAVREWQLSKLNLILPEAQLAATGTWGAGAVPGVRAPSRAAMDFTLPLADSGAFVERLGMGKVLRGGKGSLAGSVAVAGLAALSGHGQDDRPDQGRDRRRASSSTPAPARRACSACSACSRCSGGCCSTSATCSRRASSSTTSPAT